MTAETLHDRDFVTWTERQAAALRKAGSEGANLPLDWELLAEEIEDLGRSVSKKVARLAFQIQVHLLKLACFQDVDPRAHWMNEVDAFRRSLERELSDNRALRARFDTISADETADAIKDVERQLVRAGRQTALPILLHWKLRGIAAEEVRADGVYPEVGSLDFGQSEAN